MTDKTDQLIKSSILETYRKKFQKQLGMDITSMMLQYKPEKGPHISLLLALKNGDPHRAEVEDKDALFLKKLMLPKLKKEIRKIHGKVDFHLFVTCIEFATDEITLFSEFTTEKNELKNYLITI